MDDHPPVKEGYVRVYEDHTGRWFTDYPEEEVESWKNDPLMKALNDAIVEEINKEIIAEIMNV